MTGIGPRRRRTDRRTLTRANRLSVESLEGRLLLAVVLNTDDDGPGSLRQAIIDTNSNPSDNIITFNIPGSGVRTIVVGATTGLPLPTITEPLTIDGPTPPSGQGPQIELLGDASLAPAANGLVFTGGNSLVNDLAINGFTGNGLVLMGIGGNQVFGVNIGIKSDGVTVAGNGLDGILIDNSPNNIIGGTATTARNLVGGNSGNGIRIVGANALENRIQNSYIGTNTAVTVDLGNGGSGILINGASSNVIGGTATNMPNTLAFNNGDGVRVVSGTENAIRRNSIFENSGLGIDLVDGANENIPAAVLTSATTSGTSTRLRGTLTGAKASTTYTVEVFTNTDLGPTAGTIQGRTFRVSQTVSTDASGNATINLQLTGLPLGQYVTVTLTDLDGNTSEFSNPVENQAPSANFSITGALSPQPVARNGYLTYTYTVSNAGPSEGSASFLTSLPTTLSFVTATSTRGVVSRTGNTVRVEFDSVNPDASETITIVVVPTTVGSINTTATVTSPEDPDTGNNSVSLTAQVLAGINLFVTGAAIPTEIRLGEEVAFRFVVTNTGEVTSTNTIMREQLPEVFEFVSVTSSQGTVTADPVTGLIGAQIGSLAPSASAEVTVVVRPRNQGVLYNGMAASGSEPEINPANNFGVASVNVLPAVTPIPPDTIAPTVIRLSRYGTHRQPTSILVGFSEPIDVATAEDLANYQLVSAGRDGRFGTADDVAVPLLVAQYDSVNTAVTLTTRHPVGLAQPLQITINGSTPTGVRGLDGLLLDGANTGQPGSNFVRSFRGYGPGSLTTSALATRRLGGLRV